MTILQTPELFEEEQLKETLKLLRNFQENLNAEIRKPSSALFSTAFWSLEFETGSSAESLKSTVCDSTGYVPENEMNRRPFVSISTASANFFCQISVYPWFGHLSCPNQWPDTLIGRPIISTRLAVFKCHPLWCWDRERIFERKSSKERHFSISGSTSLWLQVNHNQPHRPIELLKTTLINGRPLGALHSSEFHDELWMRGGDVRRQTKSMAV